MKRLKKPPFSFENILQNIFDNMRVKSQKKYVTLLNNARLLEEDFLKKSETYIFYTNPKHHNFGNEITKEDLTNLYTHYLVNSKKKAREMYYDPIISSTPRCPMCIGIGEASSIDHYLPKKKFPLFSLMPGNLLPCCSRCNTLKGEQCPSSYEDQLLHYYFDKKIFFDEKWLFVKVDDYYKENLTITYYVDPPKNWNKSDQDRIRKNFETYQLSKRLPPTAASFFIEKKNAIIRYNIPNNLETLVSFFQEEAESFESPNDWRAALCVCIAENKDLIKSLYKT